MNGITVEPRKFIINASAVTTQDLLEKHGVEAIQITFDLHNDGDAIRRNTVRLNRYAGPATFA